jgi:hypothetical protein
MHHGELCALHTGSSPVYVTGPIFHSCVLSGHAFVYFFYFFYLFIFFYFQALSDSMAKHDLKIEIIKYFGKKRG